MTKYSTSNFVAAIKAIFCSLILLFSLTIATLGQLIPYGLRLEMVQNEIIQNTSEFDSLVLIDKASYWSDNRQICGFGFKENETYKLTIIFSKDSTFYDISIDRIKKKKLTNFSKLYNLKMTNYSVIESFSNDSLNLKSRTNIYMDISDQPEWTFLSIKKYMYVLKQSYAPEIYQNIAPTKERQIFM